MHQDNLQTRFNQTIKNKNQISGNFAYMSTRSDNQNIFQFLDTTGASGVNAGVSYRRNITSRYFATIAFQYSRFATRVTPFFANRENISGAAGIKGNDQSALNWGPPSLQQCRSGRGNDLLGNHSARLAVDPRRKPVDRSMLEAKVRARERQARCRGAPPLQLSRSSPTGPREANHGFSLPCGRYTLARRAIEAPRRSQMTKRSTMMEPSLEILLSKVEDSKFTLVTLSAKRAREINTYFNGLGGGLGAIVPPQVTSLSRKPVSIALQEISEDKIVAVYPPPEDAD